MELYIFDRGFNLIGIIESFTSLSWLRRYHKSGEFTLYLKATKENISLTKKENIVYFKGSVEAGSIETINLNLKENGDEEIIVKGKFITGYLNRRINNLNLTFRGTYELLMKKLVSENCINTESNRIIPGLTIEESKGFEETTIYNNSYGNVLEILEEISLLSNLGFRIEPDINSKKMMFRVYKGVDRSVSNTSSAPCIFSRDFENMLSQNYFDSINNYKNVALVAGYGVGSSRKKITLNDENSGLDRHELFIDARDIQETEYINGKEVTISETDYINMLKTRGEEKIASYYKVNNFDGKINTLGNNKYKVDYDLGDIVTVLDRKWGVKIDVRITEIEEVYEEKGLEINITFGNAVPTLIDKIKQVVK